MSVKPISKIIQLQLRPYIRIVPSRWQILIIWFPLNNLGSNSQSSEPHEDKMLQLLCAVFQPALVQSQYANLLPSYFFLSIEV